MPYNYNFEWDPAKAKSNFDKHGVTFEQAAGVFQDESAMTVFDEDNSSLDEERRNASGRCTYV